MESQATGQLLDSMAETLVKLLQASSLGLLRGSLDNPAPIPLKAMPTEDIDLQISLSRSTCKQLSQRFCDDAEQLMKAILSMKMRLLTNDATRDINSLVELREKSDHATRSNLGALQVVLQQLDVVVDDLESHLANSIEHSLPPDDEDYDLSIAQDLMPPATS